MEGSIFPVEDSSPSRVLYSARSYSIPCIDHTLYVLVDKSQATRQVIQISLWLLLSIGGLLTLMLLLLFALYRPLIRSLKQLTDYMKTISAGERRFFKEDVPISQGFLGSSEINDISLAFNEMLHETDRLNHTIFDTYTQMYELEVTNRKTEIAFLRSQINPHFLFNTLNVILYTAQQEGAARTHGLIGSLSRLFRYALASNDSQVPLAREVRIVDEFYALYRERFGSRVRLCWHIGPEVDLPDVLVPSFILQPLVENAFKHGLAPKEEGGQVDVTIRQERGALEITVADDGVGMDRAALDALRDILKNPPSTGEHIGVYNVAARLRLWGKEYGMDIQSEQGRGTAAVLRLPLVLSWEEDSGDD